jgi:tetratricopeptide (TPR) repeat protein
MAAGLALAAAMWTGLLWREKGKTEQALRIAQEARRREREALRFTFLASDRIAAEALAKLNAAGPPGGQDQEFCRQALTYYEEIAHRYRDDSEMRPLAAAAFHRVGFIRMILATDGAEEAYLRSIGLYDAEQSGGTDVPGSTRELAQVLDDLGRFLRKSRGFAPAEPFLRRSLEIQRRLFEVNPAASELLISHAYHQLEFADLLESDGRPSDADNARRQLGDRLDRAVRLIPDDARLLNNLAWLLVKSRRTTPREVALATILAERAVALNPRTRAYWHTLGLARYREGKWEAAATAFESSMKLQQGGDAYDWVFLASIRHRQGDAEMAGNWYDRARAWATENAPGDEDLRRFLVEAAVLLNRKDPEASSSDPKTDRR